jgi:hypothetical protein
MQKDVDFFSPRSKQRMPMERGNDREVNMPEVHRKNVSHDIRVPEMK